MFDRLKELWSELKWKRFKKNQQKKENQRKQLRESFEITEQDGFIYIVYVDVTERIAIKRFESNNSVTEIHKTLEEFRNTAVEFKKL